jgi:hypothetical protein
MAGAAWPLLDISAGEVPVFSITHRGHQMWALFRMCGETFTEMLLALKRVGSLSKYRRSCCQTDTRVWEPLTFFFVWIPFYLQAVQIHSANGVKLLEAWRGVLNSTPPYQ